MTTYLHRIAIAVVVAINVASLAPALMVVLRLGMVGALLCAWVAVGMCSVLDLGILKTRGAH